MLTFKREQEVFSLALRHLDKVKDTFSELINVYSFYLNGDKKFKEHCFKVHKAESEADAIQREIEVILIEGAFLPEIRRDFLNILDFIDKVGNQAEIVSDDIILTRPEFPEYVKGPIMEILKITQENFSSLEELYLLIGKEKDKVIALAESVREIEQKVDSIEWDLIKNVFKSDLDLAKKLHLKENIINTALISNIMEDVSDRFLLVNIRLII